MPLYSYDALSEQGNPVEGEAAAASADALRRDLEARGLLVRAVRGRRRIRGGSWRRRVRPEALLLCVQELTALLRAGLTVPDALAHVAERPAQPVLARTLSRVAEDVQHGAQLSDACAHHPDVFDALLIAALRTGERTGDLATVLTRYQRFLKQRIELGKKLGQALAYPAFLLLTLVVVLALLFVFVLPRFVAMYAGLDAALPWPTRVLMTAVERIEIVAPIAAGLVALAVWALRAWASSARGREQRDRLKAGLPWIGGVVRAHTVTQMSRTLAALIASGMPLVEAMRVTAEALTNRDAARRLSHAAGRVLEGEGLAQALAGERLVPDTAAKMIEAGEASGDLEGLLDEVGLYYEELLAHHLARVTALIEPALMLVMGVLVGGIIVVMYLPIFNMASVIR